MSPSRGSDVLVLGGGIVGLSAARALAALGARVRVVETAGIAAEASGAAAGMLAPQAEAAPGSPLLDLGLRALRHHALLADELASETGIDVGLGSPGLLEVAADERDAGLLSVRLAWQRARGLAVESLTAAELREVEPGLSASLVSAVLVPGDRWIDNVRLTRAVAASATARGAELVCGKRVTSLLTRGGRVRGVLAGEETLEAGIIINALGAWAGLLPGDPAPPPVEPVRGHLVAFATSPGLRHVVVSPRGYLVPRSDGRIVAGSTSDKVGFDKSVTPEGVRKVMDIAREIAPRLGDAQMSNAWAGLRPGTVDGLPVLGPGGVEGLFHAAGLYRNGILLGPLLGQMVAEVALGAPLPQELAPFGLARFALAKTRMHG